jgi:Domain of unknown function (DUF5671)
MGRNTQEELSAFVREALARGVSRAEIARTLTEAGWRPEAVRDALAAWADREFPVPVPAPRAYLSAREAYLYLLLFGSLYLSVFHLGSLLFSFIDRALPDPADAALLEDTMDSAARWSVAVLLIAFPLYLWLAQRTRKAVDADPRQRDSRVRKWLGYLTLFLAASALVGDMIALLNGLLSGELETRFLLKTLVVAVLGGSVLLWYWHELRADDPGATAVPAAARRAAAIAATTVVAVATAVHFAYSMSPAQLRAERLDERRLADLNGIANAVETFRDLAGRWPTTLAELENSADLLSLADLVSGEPYGYRFLDAQRYELCAVFNRASRAPAMPYERFGPHGAGRHCFTVKATATEAAAAGATASGDPN